MGIIEVFTVDEHIREFIVNKAQSWEIKQYAVEQLGMTTLRQDGLKKAAMGLTSLEEVLQVTSEE
jgi:general secretion pathway protein E